MNSGENSFRHLVRALSLNVAALLALVADLLATSGLLRTVPRIVARLATVVALHAVDALARHVAITTAGVAGLASTATVAAVAAVGVATESGLGAAAGNVALLAALVALSAGLASSSSASLGAVTRDVAGLAALVAGLVVLHGLSAVTAEMTLAAAVVALGRSLGGAVTGLVASVAARVTRSTGCIIHD